MAQLVCKDLTLGYEGRTVLQGLNFSVQQGDYLCIVGENGSGKSTLMKTILHLQEPLSGAVIAGDGLDFAQIGYLPQQTVVQRDFPASVREIVRSGCLNQCGWRPFYNKKDKEKAHQNMERLGIIDLEKRCYRELSGGQQQRVLLARALCAASRMLILDEPVAGLDPRASSELYELIDRLNQDGITIIMVSHDEIAAKQYATHILHVGDSVFFGTRDEYFESVVGKRFFSFAGGARNE